MTEREWFNKVAFANFLDAREIYYSEVDRETYDLAMEHDEGTIDTEEVQVYTRSDGKAVLFSPSKEDLERCTANVLYYESFDLVPTSEGQMEDHIAEMGLSPEEEKETRDFYTKRMEALKRDYCKPIAEYRGHDGEIEL